MLFLVIMIESTDISFFSINKEATRKEKTLFTFPYYEVQIKSRGFSSRKQNEENLKQEPNFLLFER